MQKKNFKLLVMIPLCCYVHLKWSFVSPQPAIYENVVQIPACRSTLFLLFCFLCFFILSPELPPQQEQPSVLDVTHNALNLVFTSVKLDRGNLSDNITARITVADNSSTALVVEGYVAQALQVLGVGVHLEWSDCKFVPVSQSMSSQVNSSAAISE